MIRTQDVPVQDYHLIVEKPDASFSPQRNAAIVQQTLADTEKYFRSLNEVNDDDFALRTDVLVSYGDYRLNRSGTKKFRDYIGPDLRKRLLGEKILSKVSVLSTVDKLQGKNKKILL